MLRIILTTGGTGGHVFPALAVAEELKKQVKDVEILFLGGRYGLEQHWAWEAGIEFAGLPVQGVLGRGMRSVGALVAMGVSVVEAISILGEFKPHAIIGFGGYASFAGVSTGILCRYPTLIHEQNAVPGLANRVLSLFVKRICLAMPDVTKKFSAKKVCLTGNPVRTEIVQLPEKEYSGKSKRLLIMGGSQGANSINQAIIRNLPKFKEAGVEIWHQTGNADYVAMRTEYEKIEWSKDKAPQVLSFIDDVAKAYAWADLVVCRSGASTVAELAVAGIPSVLVPFPHATHNHQLYNAKYLADGGGAVLVEDKNLQEENFASIVLDLLDDPAKLTEMSKAAKKLSYKDAAAKVAKCIQEVLPAKLRQEVWP